VTNDAFCAMLLVASVPAGIAGGILGVWLARMLMSIPLMVW